MKENELSCKDLMIGDWVFYSNKAFPYQIKLLGENLCKLDGIDNSVDLDYIHPVLLTEKILEKNGFVKFIAGQYLLPAGGNEWIVTIIPNLISAPNSNGTMLIAIKNIYTDAKIAITYVHQLQHALKLCGIDKTIEL